MAAGCGSGGSTSKILIGLQRVGIVGLQEAFAAADESGLTDPDDIVSLLLETVSRQNYVPESSVALYRKALLREFLRYKGKDFRAHYSEIDVLVRGAPGAERDRFVEALRAVLSEFELKPVVHFAPPDEQDPRPQLLMEGEIVLAGNNLTESAMKPSIKKRVSDW